MFNFKKFLIDYKIPIGEEGNTAPGWINIKCPFCSDHSNHLGWNIEQQYFNCWKCGWHSIIDVIMILTNNNFHKSKELLKQYIIGSNYIPICQEKKTIINDIIHLPTGTKELSTIHRNYLINRNFDPDHLIQKYNLKGTLYTGNYKFRIIAPIYYNGKLVSYQGRDVTDKQKLRYKACSKKNEIIHHKYILYNLDNCLSNKIIIVEGITDVWRIGDNCACTFGIAYTIEQILLLSSRFNTVFILYDTEEKAQEKAYSLAQNLNIYNLKTEIITLDQDDPAKFPDDEIIYMKKNLLE